ncbi:DUF1616 domain-containing protein (plasmid) [Halorientalis pallida]|uniref:DUF1616 domain-containing protein n=1 Tax=Halorientalis pallida TaxID=2479928 RepID=UPI003C6FCA79
MNKEPSSSVQSSSTLETITELPGDAGASFTLAVVGGVCYSWPSLTPPVLRTLVGLPLLLFAPGYTLLAALFPAAHDRTDDPRGWNSTDHWLDWPARLALSLGASVAIVPLVALGVSLAGADSATVPFVVTVLVATGAALAAIRRVRLPRPRRLRPPTIDGWGERSPRAWESRGVRLAVLTLLAGSILVATATMGYALVVPNDGESYSSIYLATENGSDDPVAASFPSTFDDRPRELVVGVENHENTRTNYTVVAQLQRVETTDGSISVTQRDELRRFEVELAPGETWERTHEIDPTMAGENLRLTYALYRSGPTGEPATAEPYRRTYIWVDVTAPTGDS